MTREMCNVCGDVFSTTACPNSNEGYFFNDVNLEGMENGFNAYDLKIKEKHGAIRCIFCPNCQKVREMDNPNTPVWKFNPVLLGQEIDGKFVSFKLTEKFDQFEGLNVWEAKLNVSSEVFTDVYIVERHEPLYEIFEDLCDYDHRCYYGDILNQPFFKMLMQGIGYYICECPSWLKEGHG